MNLNEINSSIIASMCDCPSEYRNKLLKVALILAQSSNQDRAKTLNKISSDFDIPRYRIDEILGVYLAIIQLFVQTTDKDFIARLLELGFPDHFLQDLPLVGNRSEVVDTILSSRKADFGKLAVLKWRIDISLQDSSLVNRIPPTIILSLQLKNGDKYVITVDMKAFHKLRFNIALMVKELENAKKNRLVFK